MSRTFTGSIPTAGKIEKLRLILSTFQDGTGQLVFETGRSLPGWRDFERAAALAAINYSNIQPDYRTQNLYPGK
jgi:hypothetical protein